MPPAAHRPDRLCSRPGCAADASATMTYDYAARAAWLDELAPEADPNQYDLCPAHADRLAVPQAWARTDRWAAATVEVRPAPAPLPVLFERIAV